MVLNVQKLIEYCTSSEDVMVSDCLTFADNFEIVQNKPFAISAKRLKKQEAKLLKLDPEGFLLNAVRLSQVMT